MGYPTDSEIRPKWSKFHLIILILSSVLIWGAYIGKLIYSGDLPPWTSTLSLVGLHMDIIGVLVVSLKTPFFGYFHDGGKLESKRELSDNKTFRKGMILITFGFAFQAISILFNNS